MVINPLSAKKKNATENVVCWSRLLQIIANVSIQAKSVDPEQIGAVWSGFTLLAIEAS